MLGLFRAHVGSVLAYVGPILGPCWAILSPSLATSPILGHFRKCGKTRDSRAKIAFHPNLKPDSYCNCFQIRGANTKRLGTFSAGGFQVWLALLEAPTLAWVLPAAAPSVEIPHCEGCHFHGYTEDSTCRSGIPATNHSCDRNPTLQLTGCMNLSNTSIAEDSCHTTHKQHRLASNCDTTHLRYSTWTLHLACSWQGSAWPGCLMSRGNASQTYTNINHTYHTYRRYHIDVYEFTMCFGVSGKASAWQFWKLICQECCCVLTPILQNTSYTAPGGAFLGHSSSGYHPGCNVEYVSTRPVQPLAT